MSTMSKDKGARGETQVRDYLRLATGLGFERTPSSGALNIVGLKGDLFVPNHNNLFTIEVKFYEADEFSTKILSGKGTFIDWWNQTVREAKHNKNEPMLIYKWNRSKLYFVLPDYVQTGCENYIAIGRLNARIYAGEELNLKKLFGVIN